MLLALLLALSAILLPAQAGSAEPNSQQGWTTDAQVDPENVGRGGTATVSVSVTSESSRRALVDIEIYDADGLVHQQYFDARRFRAGQTRTFTTEWTVPANAAYQRHYVRVGVFAPGWSQLQHWNHNAGSFTVTGTSPPTSTTSTTTTTPTSSTTTTTPPSTTTTAPPTTTTAPPTTTTAPPTTTTTNPPGSGRFETLPPGAQLPSEATCAARVRSAPEIRPQNATSNATRGSAPHPQEPRVTGNYTGTTDQILQWAACKWGIDEDIVRAQIARESWWVQASGGDYSNDPNACHPALRGTVPCPESYGLGMVRYLYHTPAMDNSIRSSAYNVDYVYSVWRSCYDGELTWLNTVERGRQYAAGDVWGCIGVWYSGRWYTQAANDYIGWVSDYFQQRIWLTSSFINYRG